MTDLPDYIHDVSRLKAQLAELNQRETELTQEMDGANDIDLGLTGPERAAGYKLNEIQRLKERAGAALEIVEKGYELWELEGFEQGVDACGNTWCWTEVSDALTATISVGNPNALVRIPLEVQGAYAKAHLTGLFKGFTLATAFDTEIGRLPSGGEDYMPVPPISNWLFALAASESLSEGELFHVANWSSSE